MNDSTTREGGVLEARVEGVAEDGTLPKEPCLLDGMLKPCILVIIGASGDLTARKLVPSLFNLYLNDGLPDSFLILGCGRTRMGDDEFRERMKKTMTERGGLDREKWDAFARFLFYRPVEYDDLPAYVRLAEYLHELDNKYETGGNRIFYLAVPPVLYETTARMLRQAWLQRSPTLT